MARLSILLPPFSPDYSGAASALFDMNCLTVLHDASGCTGNFIGFDEPRWYGTHVPVYCSGLREIDAIMGDDEKLIAKVLSAQKSINADMIAIVGSPVPMIVGCDVAGIAHEIEERAGVPSFGFDTTGLRYYDYGVSIACDALVKRFVRPCAKSSEPSVNILGADTIDFGITPTIASLRRLLAESGYSCSAVMPCGLSLDTLTNMTAAHVNLVVSRSGLSTAKLLHDRYGIPYLVGLPYGEKCIPEYFGMLEQVRRSGVNAVYGISSDNSSLRKAENGGGVLVIGEQVACNAIRMAVEKDGEPGPVTVGCLFGMEQELCRPYDVNLADEKEISEAINDNRYSTVFADPFLKWLLRNVSKRFFPIPHYGVSSKIHAREAADSIGGGFDAYLASLENRDATNL
ncbi:MAG: nitrogenase component 1 [Sphaerochaetaceae bacterium]|jgi:hypothetical protein